MPDLSLALDLVVLGFVVATPFNGLIVLSLLISLRELFLDSHKQILISRVVPRRAIKQNTGFRKQA